MRIVAFIVLLLVSTMTFSETIIRATLQKDQHYYMSSWKKFLKVDNDFPQQEYIVKAVELRNPVYHHISINNDIVESALIYINLKLDLISYDKSNGSYKFNLTITQAGIAHGNKFKNLVGAIYFDLTRTNRLLLTGRFKKVPVLIEKPNIQEFSKQDFMLSVDKFNNITLSSQHDIPITIILHN